MKKEPEHATKQCTGCKGIFLSKELINHFGIWLCGECGKKQAKAVQRSMAGCRR